MDLHPEFLKWVDAQSDRIVGLAEIGLKNQPQGDGMQIHPDQPIAANITKEAIRGPVIRTMLDSQDKPIAWHISERGKDICGFTGAAFQDVQKTAEAIWDRKEVRNQISRSTVEDHLKRWAVEAASSRTPPPFSTQLTILLNKSAATRTVWFPVEDLYLEGELPFGEAIISPLSRAELERTIAENGKDPAQPETERLLKEWAGATIIRFNLAAEPGRAIELARERANDYLALLQFYAPQSMILSMASHIAPRGLHPYRTEDVIIFGEGFFSRTRTVSEYPCRWEITAEYRENMDRICLATMSKLATGTECEYEEDLLQSLLVYGRASYRSNPTDKFLQVMTAVEMFALEGTNEPIQTTIADRIAFAICRDPGARMKAVDNFKAAYGQRSRGTHHGKSIESDEIINEFLKNVWSFFYVALRNVGMFKTRQEFLKQLDALKYQY